MAVQIVGDVRHNSQLFHTVYNVNAKDHTKEQAEYQDKILCCDSQ